MNRREWMIVSAGCIAGLVCGHPEASSLSSKLDASMCDATDVFDHILLGAPDLDLGIRWVEERTGVRAKFGGNHPGSGTRNALLSLGTGHYLEIIAPDPAQANAPDDRGLRELSSPRIIQWAIHTEKHYRCEEYGRSCRDQDRWPPTRFAAASGWQAASLANAGN